MVVVVGRIMDVVSGCGCSGESVLYPLSTYTTVWYKVPVPTYRSSSEVSTGPVSYRDPTTNHTGSSLPRHLYSSSSYNSTHC